MTASANAWTRRCRRLHLTWVYRGTRRRRRSTLRHYPQLDGQVLAVSAVYGDDAVGADASVRDQVVLRTVAAPLRLARTAPASAVADQVTLRGRLVLKLDGEVVESGLLVVEPDVPVLVHLARHGLQDEVRRARRRGRALATVAAHVNRGRHRGVARQARRAHRDRVGALT